MRSCDAEPVLYAIGKFLVHLLREGERWGERKGKKRGNNRGEKGRVMRDGRSNAGKVPLEATIPYHTL